MAQQVPGTIFVGITPPPVREYVQMVLKAAMGRYSRLVAPCVGRFTIPQLARGEGWPVEAMEASDISLYSTVIGYHCAGLPMSDLGVEVAEGMGVSVERYFDGGPLHGAAILYALKFLTLDRRSLYGEQFAKQMIADQDSTIASMAEQMDRFKAKLDGIQYEALDMWEHIERTLDDEDVILYVNPPTFSKGYEKLFETHGLLTWREPAFRQYDPANDTGRLHEMLDAHSGLTLMHKWGDMQGIPNGRQVFSTVVGNTSPSWVLSNRPGLIRDLLDIRAKPPKPDELGKPKWPLLQDSHPITKDSVAEVIPIDAKQARYYRQLWVHGFGGTSAQRYFLGLIDGRAAMVMGTMHQPHSTASSTETAWAPWGCLHFCIAAPSRRRLQRLFLAMTTTERFKAMAFVDLPERQGIQSSCFSKHPTVNSYRGIYRLRLRERQKDDRYRLVYEATFSDRNFGDIYRDWHAKEAKRLASETL